MITKSSNFIKMCEQAEEIQEGHKWKDNDKLAYRRCINVRDCDYEELIKHPEYYEMTYGTRKVFETIDIDKPIYLPTQEQLQEMIFGEYTGIQTITSAIEQFSKNKIGCDISIIGEMNELWLAFVMKEKYNKIWDGKDWKKWKE